MAFSSQHTRFALTAALCLAPVCALNAFFSPWIDHLHASRSFSLLNALTFADGQYPVEFYAGRIYDLWAGPLTAVICGLVFLHFARVFLRDAGFWAFAGAVFVFLLLTKFPVLFYPPYGDAIIGPFSDAMWLLRHGFDYPQYFRLEDYSTGGPQTYPTSLYPSFLALVLKIAPTAEAFLVTVHLITFAMGALTVAALRELCRGLCSGSFAEITSLCLLALPLFWTQTELINMEMACTLFGVLAAWAAVERRFFLASLSAVAALLIKSPGVMVCAGVFAAAALAFLLDDSPRRDWRSLACAATALACAGVNGYLRKILVGDNVVYNQVGLGVGWGNVVKMSSFWFFIVLSVVFLAVSIFRYLEDHESFHPAGYLRVYLGPLIMLLFTAAWFALYINFSVMIPRYQLLVAPFLMFLTVYTAHLLVRNPAAISVLFAAFFIFLYSSAHGWVYFDKGLDTINRHNKFERSLEYRNNLKLHMALAGEVETYYHDWSVGAPLLLAQILNFHELGYLKQSPRDIIVYGMKSNHEGMRDFPGLQNLDLYKTIWIGFDGDRIADFPYPLAPEDKVIKTFYRGNKKGYLFMGGLGIDKYLRTVLLRNRLTRVLGK